jgi:hypothetical protein
MYSCTPGVNTTLSTCTGPVPNTGQVNTGTVGNDQCFTVTATDADGQTASATNCFNVVALTYTGLAYNAGLTATVTTAGIPVSVNLPPIETTGEMNTTSTSFSHSAPTLVSIGSTTGGLLGATALSDTTSTAPGTATGSSSTELSQLLEQAVNDAVITTTSSTTCSKGSLSYSGGTTIASLKIGSTTINLPNPIPPNDAISVPGIGTVTLNQQLPLLVGGVQEGLIVNGIAINVHVTLSTLVTANVNIVISHSESDIEGGCSSVTA